MRLISSINGFFLLAAAIFHWSALAATVRADGWHSPILQSASPGEWLSMGVGPGAGSFADLEKEELDLVLQRKYQESVDVLKYMDPANIYPREFPRFDKRQIPLYREAAKAVLARPEEGSIATVVERLRSELMGFGQRGFGDVRVSPLYLRDLLQVLAAAARRGDIPEDQMNSLRLAMAGQKPAYLMPLLAQLPPILKLNVIATTLKTSKDLSVGKLTDLLDQTEDRDLKKTISELIVEKTQAASTAELAAELENDDLDRSVRNRLTNELRKRAADAGVMDLLMIHAASRNRLLTSVASQQLEKRVAQASHLELLNMVRADVSEALTQQATEALAGKRPTSDEVKEDFLGYWELFASKDARVAGTAYRYLADAVRKASPREMVIWISAGDPQLASALWREIDRRIAGLDEDGKRALSNEAFGLLQSGEPALKLVSIELLKRLKRREVVPKLFELSSAELPPQVWPEVGILLHELTGQDIGPETGDSTEVDAALDEWRAWWQSRAEKE